MHLRLLPVYYDFLALFAVRFHIGYGNFVFA